MDGVAHDTCREEGGGGMLMDDASVDTSELGRGRRPRRRWDGLMNGVASGDACDGEWGDGDNSLEPWSSREY